MWSGFWVSQWRAAPWYERCLDSLASQGTCSGAPCRAHLLRLPFHGLPGIGGLSLLCPRETRKVQSPFTSPHPTFLQDRDQDVGGVGLPSEPHPTSLYLAATVFLLLYSVLKATSRYCTGSVWLLGPATPLGGNEAEAQKTGGVPRLWKEHLGRQVLCSSQRRCMSPGGRAFT